MVLSLVLAPLLTVGTAVPAQAASTPFEQKFSANVRGDVVIRGNTLMTCSTTGNSGGTCVDARQGNASGSLDNNEYTSEWVDVDGDPATVNSSKLTLDLPARGQVLYAALVWGARSTDPAIGTALFDTPATPGYQFVSSAAADLSNGDSSSYQSFVDVTDLVRAGGSGVYTLADVKGTLASDQYAGWALVVAVGDSSRPARNLTVYRGFTTINNGHPTESIAIDGFVTPKRGDRRTTLGFVVYEGDRGKTGDSLKLNGTAVGDARNPTTNIFNATLTDRGTVTGGRTPAYDNQMGFDADLVSADNILGSGATSATIDLTTGGEAYYPGVVTFATDLYEPQLDGTKSVSSSTAGGVTTLSYTVPVANVGLDASVDSRVADAIPIGTTYVPGSLRIDGTPVTDAPGDDTGYLENSPNGARVVAHVGAGATDRRGGRVEVGNGSPQFGVSFQVTVDAATPAGADIENLATYDYRGADSGEAAGSPTNVVAVQKAGTPVGGSNPVTRADRASLRPTPAQPSVTVRLLDNDSPGLTLDGVTDPAGGSVSVDPATGTIVYTPRSDFDGEDGFSYAVLDAAGNRSVETVYVQVLDDAPDANPDTASGSKNSPILVPVLGNDSDPNGDPLTLRSATTPAHGTTTLVGNQVRFTPAPGWTGTDTFDYVVVDARGTPASARVTVTVTNRAPVGNPDSVLTQTGAAVSFPSVLGNDSDPDGDSPLTAAVANQPGAGTVVLNADGTGTWTPPAGFSGTASFSYLLSDPTGAVGPPVTVALVANAAPVTVDDAVSTPTDTAVDIDVLIDDSDPENDPLSIATVGQGVHGSVIAGSSGHVMYTPAAGFAGTDSFVVTVTDGRGGTATETVTVTVLNAGPVANPDTGSGQAGVPLDLPVLGNDTDPNIPGTAQQLTLVSATTASPDATVTVTGNSIRVLTAATFAGTVSGAYTVTDGAGGSASSTFSVTISGAHPVATDDGRISTPTNTGVLIDVLANDSDADGDVLGVDPTSLGEPRSNGVDVGTLSMESGRVRFDPAPGFSGPVTFTYAATDGANADTAVVTLTVANAIPVAAPDTASTATNTAVDVAVLANDTDANTTGLGNQTLHVVTASADQGATVARNPDDSLRVVPATGFRGTLTVSYTVSDGAGGTATSTVTVTVTNAAPVARPDSAATPSATPVTVTVLGNDSDANADPLTLTAVDTPEQGARPAGTATIDAGRVRFVPDTGVVGDVTVTYTVSDGSDSASSTVTVTVANAVPVASDDTAATATNTPVEVDVLANDTDANVTANQGGQQLTVSTTSADHGASATVVSGRVRVTPAPGFKGALAVAYSVSDGAGGSANALLHVTVANAVPVATPDTVATPSGTPVTVAVLDNDTDANADPLSVVSLGAPLLGTTPAGTAVVDGSGVRFTPTPGILGPVIFAYSVGDGTATTASTVTVQVANADPVTLAQAVATPSATPVTVDVLTRTTDVNVTAGFGGQVLTVVSASAQGGAVVTVNPDGTLTVGPAGGVSGLVLVTYTVSDGAGGSATGTVEVTVANAAPVTRDDVAETPTSTALDLDPVGNDRDDNGDRLSVLAVLAPRDADGVLRGTTSVVDGRVRFVPQPGFAGRVTFAYTATDGQTEAVGSVTVSVLNAAPVVPDQHARTDWATPVTVDVLAAAADANVNVPPVTRQRLRLAEGPRVVEGSATVATDPTGRLVVRPTGAQVGDVVVVFSVVDGAGGVTPARLTVSVDPVAPRAVADVVQAPAGGGPTTVAVLDNDLNPEGGSLQIVAVSASRAGARVTVVDGRVVYVPPAGFSGPDSFTYTVRNAHGLESTVTVTVMVAGAVVPVTPDRPGARVPVAVAVAGPVRARVAETVSALARTGFDGARVVTAGITLAVLGGGLLLVGSTRPGPRHVARHRAHRGRVGAATGR